MTIIGWILFCFGGFVCASNFYFSFLRYPILRLTGRNKEEIENESGIPLVASPIMLVGAILIRDVPYVQISAVFLFLIDTGGLHWFFFTVLYHSIFSKS
jgi:hypothetical protein